MTRTPHRSALRVLFALGLAAGVAIVIAIPRPAVADTRDDARASYEQGKKMYAAGDYKGAISAFARAEQLAPSAYNDFNIALCYDKLGEASIAVQYYRSYLQKQPDASNKAAVEASIARLDAAAKAAEAKAEEARKAADAKRVEEERRAEEARKAAEDQRRTEDQRRADDQRRTEDQRMTEELARKAEEQRRMNAGGGTGAGAGTGVGPVGTGGGAPTGDPELDRVQGIDVNSVRAERGGFEGTAPAANNGPAGTGAGGGAGAGVATTDPNNPTGQTPTDQPKPRKPVYKQWWFWVVVGVSAYVLISIAAADKPNNQARLQGITDDHDGAQDVERRWTVLPDMGRDAIGVGGGATLMRW